MFGPNASLDVSGSFYVSTADYLALGSSGRFDATNPAASVLSIAPPSAFGFLGAPAPVSFNGSTISVPAGNTLSVVAGDISLSGAILYAPGGRVNVASLASAGTVALVAAGIDVTAGTLGAITATNSIVDTSSAFGLASGAIYIRGGSLTMQQSFVASENGEAGTGGNVDVRLSGAMQMDGGLVRSATGGLGDAGNVVIQAGTLSLLNGAQVGSGTFGPGKSGNATVSAAESILVSGSDSLGFPSGIFSSAESGGVSRGAGSVTIAAPVVTLDQGGVISSNTAGSGDAGSISISTGRLTLANGAQITGSTSDTGRGGAISIVATESVSISGASNFGSYDIFPGSGSTGNISVTTPLFTGDNSTISTISRGTGNAGNIDFNVGTLNLFNGTQINSSTFGSGHGGNVTVHASESITASGYSGFIISGIFNTAGNFGPGGSTLVTTPSLLLDGGVIATGSILVGNGGPLTVHVGNANLINGGRIDASSFFVGNGGSIEFTVTGTLNIGGRRDAAATETILREFVRAQAGDLVTDATYALLRPAFGDFAASGVVSRSVLGGAGGAIHVTAGDITIGPGGIINAGSSNSGSAGSITLDVAGALKLTGGASISTQAAISDGGNITINARDLVYLEDSRITTSVGTGLGNGGNIVIDPVFVVLNNGQIIANAFGGNGGNISIVSDFFLADPASLVQASSQFGLQGAVTVSAPNVNLGAGLVALPGAFFDASSMMRTACAARASHASNSFTGAPRGGLPAGPERYGFASYSGSVPGPRAGADAFAANTIQLACMQ
jgi:large exoprotein involved in heme utilization and adhesion